MVKENRVAEIFLCISHLIVADPVDFRDGESECMKMARHIDEGAVLVTIGPHHTNDGTAFGVRLACVNPIGALLLRHNVKLKIKNSKLRIKIHN